MINYIILRGICQPNFQFFILKTFINISKK